MSPTRQRTGRDRNRGGRGVRGAFSRGGARSGVRLCVILSAFVIACDDDDGAAPLWDGSVDAAPPDGDASPRGSVDLGSVDAGLPVGSDARAPDDDAAPFWPDAPLGAGWRLSAPGFEPPSPADGGTDDAGRDPEPLGGAVRQGVGRYALRAGGAGVGLTDSRDEFLFLHDVVVGAATLTARVRALDGCPPDARVSFGVMARPSLDPAAAYVLVAATGPRGVAVQSRFYAGEYARTLRLDANVPLPLWIRVQLADGLVTAAYSRDGRAWTAVERSLSGWPDEVHLGLVASSHDGARPCAALFEEVTLTGARSERDAGADAPTAPADAGAGAGAGAGG